MPMQLFSIIQFICVFILYIILTVGLPAIILNGVIPEFRCSLRLLLYFVIGNSYFSILITFLELLHICNSFSIIFITVLTAYVLAVKNYKITPWKTIKNVFKDISRVIYKQMGIRTLLHKWFVNIFQGVKRFTCVFGGFLKKHPADLLLLIITMTLIFQRYGVRLVKTYGYAASDMIVHNYWINSLGNGKIYVAGVYPYAFHCMASCFHIVFGFDNYIILSVFWLVQTIMLHLSMLVFLKCCCKNKFLPYLGVCTYLLAELFILNANAYARFFSSLPQIYGFIFILPTILFVFEFLRLGKLEAYGKAEIKNGSIWCIAGFLLSLQMTMSAHFYNTIIVAFFCAGGIIGYGFRVFRKRYFLKIAASAVLAAVIAFLPMGISLATGNHFEGSIRWATNMIKNSPEEEKEENKKKASAEEKEVTVQDEKERSSLKELVFGEKNSIRSFMALYMFNSGYGRLAFVSIVFVILLLLLSLAFMLFKKFDYGARGITVAVGTWLLMLLMGCEVTGFPTLMDHERTSAYLTYAVIVCMSMLADRVGYILFGGLKRATFLLSRLSFGTVLIICIFYIYVFSVKSVWAPDTFETNEAVTCLTNIIHDNKDHKWTICSANDELRMADEHGYHYEVIDFLDEMQGGGNRADIYIPTEKVYFFIEKTPLDYGISYDKSGQKISAAGAAQPLPVKNGLEPYKGENRWIVMSKMYEWAKKFKRMYPNEMKVYYETNDFICYYVEQNTYSLYNFAIDYSYNTRRQRAAKETEEEK